MMVGKNTCSILSHKDTLLAVSKAYEAFNDEEKYAYCKGVAEEAEALTEHKLEDKRALAKKAGTTTIEEDDPEMVSLFVASSHILYNGHLYLIFG